MISFPERAGPDARAARVLVCDDSLVIRGAIARALRAETGIEVVASVCHGQAAIDAVRAHLDRGTPIDVAVLDIEMPVMDGMTALPHLLAIDPALRVVMASTLTLRGADIAMEALRRGAADYLPKPSTTGLHSDAAFRVELASKVRGLARIGTLARRGASADGTPTKPALAVAAGIARSSLSSRPALIAIGSSTGGPQALFTLFKGLGTGLGVPVVITQHMPATFVPMLADHLTRLGGMACGVAADREVLRPDRVVVAPGDRHLVIEAGTGGLVSRLSDAAAENFCRPSVDVMLRSACGALAGKIMVVMLTGMGRDGLEGTRLVVEAGGLALAQDEATSVVWGMPGAIAKAGLARSVLPIERLAPTVRQILGLGAVA